MKKDKISIIVPCFNEEDTIPYFYNEVNKVSKKFNNSTFEIIFINDGSKDNTLNVILKLVKKDKRIKYISFSRNFGKEAAMYAGFEVATGDYVATMDVDLQDPPGMLKEMYDLLICEDYDCVALKSEEHKDYSILRKVFTKAFYKIISCISSIEQVPGARDFRLMRKKVIKSIVSMGEYNRYSKGIFSFVGFKTKWIKYSAPDRVIGNTKWNFWKLFKYAIEGILAFSTTPLVFSAIIGILFCLVAFVAIVIIIVKTIIWGDPVGGWPSLACIIIFVSGLQLFFFGVMGMYLSKIYLEVKRRPIYIIDETNCVDKIIVTNK